MKSCLFETKAVVELCSRCSVAASLLLPDEASGVADELLAMLEPNELIYVPFIWRAELANTLLTAERRQRLSKDQREIALAQTNQWPLPIIHSEDDLWVLAYDLAVRFRLSYYDALYLRLAAAVGLPLATFDRRLADAARSLDVQVIGVRV